MFKYYQASQKKSNNSKNNIHILSSPSEKVKYFKGRYSSIIKPEILVLQRMISSPLGKVKCFKEQCPCIIKPIFSFQPLLPCTCTYWHIYLPKESYKSMLCDILHLRVLWGCWTKRRKLIAVMGWSGQEGGWCWWILKANWGVPRWGKVCQRHWGYW